MTDMIDTTKEKGSVMTSPMLVLAVFSAIGGFLFGYDTGVVSGAMLLVREDFELSTIWHESIVSATIAAAWLAALCAGPLADRAGRRVVILGASVLFTAGSVVMAVAPQKETLLVGRIVVGLAIGLASMCVPLYLSEAAESSARGRLTVTNVIFLTGGQFVASIVCGALSTTDQGWRWMFGLAAVPAIVQFVGFLFLPETPRWLVGKGRMEEARKVLLRFRAADAAIDEELATVADAVRMEEVERQSGSIVRIFSNVPVRRALVLGCLLQLFQQLAGINTVMYYSASIITMAGIGDPQTAIWISAGVASCNFIFTFVGLWLVERMGRRPLLLISLAGVVVCLLELAVSFHIAYTSSPDVGFAFNGSSTATDCSQFTSCSTCTFSLDCGFCFNDDDPLYLNATCLPSDSSQYNEVSIVGQCSEPDLPKTTFAYDWCPSEYAWLSIAGLAFYLLCFSPGMGTMPWTINSELYPGWARARCVGIATSVNWAANLLVSLTFLSLTQALNKHGTFYLYSGLAATGLVIFYWCLPETRGTSLESVSVLFRQPLFGRKPRTQK